MLAAGNSLALVRDISKEGTMEEKKASCGYLVNSPADTHKPPFRSVYFISISFILGISKQSMSLGICC